MPRFLQDITAVVVYLLFGALEIVVVWGMFALTFGAPVAVAWSMGARTGDDLLIGSLAVGGGLMFLWYRFLDNGGNKRIQTSFRLLTHRTIRKLGAGDAIHD